jgi:Bacteriocin-protection, YdeI or OmpD-Associated/Domain of unknown function (DUF1905)
MKFRTTILQARKTATGIEVPPGIVEALGSGKRPPVRVTINGYTYRSTVAVMGGVFMIGVSAENRQATGVAAGDEVEVDLELDTEPRVVTVPADLAEALDANPAARQKFDRLSYSHQLQHVLAVEGAKSAETRQRRIGKTVADLSGG